MRVAFAWQLYRLLVSLCTLLVLVPGEARPVDEMGVRIGVKRLSTAAEGDHTCFVRADGNVLCWGNNALGQIGDGTSGNTRLAPTLVSGVTSAIAVAAGRDHTCALLTSGSVRCWGLNNSGQLGVGTGTASSSLSVAVPNLSNVVSLVAGTAHTCARQSNGTVRCWGLNDSGQIGDGNAASPRFTPVAVSGLTDAVKIAAGASHTCALRGGGIMSCWGGNGQGELGNGNVATRQDTPSNVVDITEVTDIAAGRRFTCAVRSRGQLLCWGDNDLGQTGSNTRTNAVVRPAATIQMDQNGGFKPAIDIVAGRTHACASLLDPIFIVECWGANDLGQLGIGSASPSEAAPRAVSGVVGSLEIATGRGHSCALGANEVVRCWGDNALGQLGNSSTSPSLIPGGVLGLGGSVSARSLASGTNHSCAVRSDGTAACWGRNDGGAIGDGTFADRLVPTRVNNGLNVPFVSIVGGGNHTCAALDGRSLTLCWGDNRSRQVSPASTRDFEPLPIIAKLTNLIRGPEPSLPVALAAGSFHGCNASAFVSCHGLNDQGQLGDPSAAAHFAVGIGLFGNAIAVAAGGGHSCALLATGRVHCWGLNTLGQLGDGTRTSRSSPREVVGIVNAVSLSATRDHTCALLASGIVVCWGRNDFGQVDGTAGGDRLVPTPVATLAAGDAVAVTTGFQHTCILTPAGGIRCWGRNDEGQLGNASTVDSVAPVTSAPSAPDDHPCARRRRRPGVRRRAQLRASGVRATGLLGAQPGRAARRQYALLTPGGRKRRLLHGQYRARSAAFSERPDRKRDGTGELPGG